MTRNAIAPAASLELKPCECGRFTIIGLDGSRKSIPCGGVTKRVFAPGHDARLKGHLIRAAFAGQKIERAGLGGPEVRDALAWADFFNFGYMVRAGVELAREKHAAKVAKKAAKANKTEAAPEAAPEPVIVKAKVGRWIYEGEVTDAGFVYTNSKGEAVTAPKFTLI